MIDNNVQCEIQIKKGIEIQKKNKIEAVNCFKKAYKLNPLNKDVYINLGKAYMGLGQYELSMRSFLTYAHFSLFENKNKFDVFDQKFYNSYYKTQNKFDENLFICHLKDPYIVEKQSMAILDTKIVIQIEETKFSKLITDLDLIVSIGICYLTKYTDIIAFNNINELLLNNELKFINKMKFDGEILRTSEFGNMIRTIGLVFTAINLLSNPKITQNNLINIYYNEAYKLKNLNL